MKRGFAPSKRQFQFWEEVPGHWPISFLCGQSLLILPVDHDNARVASVEARGDGDFVLRVARPALLDDVSTLIIQDGRLGDQLSLLNLGPAPQILAIPPVEWAGRRGGYSFRTPVAAVGALAAGAAPLLLGGTVGGALALPIAAAVGGLLWALLRRRHPTRILTAGDLQLDATNLVDYAVARHLGERPEALTDTQRRERVAKRIDDIRTDYARRSADIVFRIENSALFDASSPTTSAFEVALVRCATEAESASLDELEALATDLEIAYSIALDSAETVGFRHLPATVRDDARRAHKAAQLAAGATTDGEREAAVSQVVRILSSLALYYLPAPEAARRELTDGAT